MLFAGPRVLPPARSGRSLARPPASAACPEMWSADNREELLQLACFLTHYAVVADRRRLAPRPLAKRKPCCSLLGPSTTMPRRRFPVQDDSASEQDLASYSAQPIPSLARLSGEAGMCARRAAAEVPLDAPGESDEETGVRTRRGRTSSLSRLWQKLEHADERPWADRKRPSSRSNGARRSESLGRPREQDWSAHRMPSESPGPDEDLLQPHAPNDPVPFAAAATTGLFSREARRRNRADSAPAAPRWTAPDPSLRGDDSSDGNEYEASAAGRRPSAATLASAPVAPFSRGLPGRAESLRPPAGTPPTAHILFALVGR